MKVQKKPVIVDVEIFDGTDQSVERIRALTGPRRFRLVEDLTAEEAAKIDPGTDAQVWDTYHSSWIGIRLGQGVIRGVKNEVYPIEHDVLVATYDFLPDDEHTIEGLDAPPES